MTYPLLKSLPQQIDNDTHGIQQCLLLAEQALPDDVPVGALIVNASAEIIAYGWNTREKDVNPCGHAEVMALMMAAKQLGDWRLNECTLYVTLEPCPMCASAIKQSRVSKVVFGAYDPVMGACGSAEQLLMTDKNVSVLGGIEEQICSTALTTFFKHSLRSEK